MFFSQMRHLNVQPNGSRIMVNKLGQMSLNSSLVLAKINAAGISKSEHRLLGLRNVYDTHSIGIEIIDI